MEYRRHTWSERWDHSDIMLRCESCSSLSPVVAMGLSDPFNSLINITGPILVRRCSASRVHTSWSRGSCVQLWAGRCSVPSHLFPEEDEAEEGKTTAQFSLHSHHFTHMYTIKVTVTFIINCMLQLRFDQRGLISGIKLFLKLLSFHLLQFFYWFI